MSENEKLPHFTEPLTDQQSLRLGTALIEHVDDLWPEGEPAATPEWIRANVDDILRLLRWMYRIDDDGRPEQLLRLPRRLHWLLWMMAELDEPVNSFETVML